MSTRLRLAILIYGMIQGVVFGIGTVLVLAVPSFSEQAMTLMPTVVILSIVLAAPIAWFVAPRMRLRFWQRREQQQAPRRVTLS
jgi:flagellar biosynthesis protein FliQ